MNWNDLQSVMCPDFPKVCPGLTNNKGYTEYDKMSTIIDH